ncbi:unnamed protein product [Rotaria sp. Silwood1]|nr:unnamed protein product [Rotaria sp. Silwood1]CAF1625023.1 unnamed protein product [Rotaria sp. Silwood1]CAF3695793.1 unnamed protein product [Rotaria sp. Silwood1]CAF3780544.1 unnamed protein product [Rotaria sp. Silwood1]CAF3782818.1 unnamed protein product [Rotaria sp. Silwood1]
MFISHPFDSILEQDLTTYIPNTASNTIQQQTTEEYTLENSNLLNVLSRVTIAAAKYPNDATLHNYGELQLWMYVHTNKRPPADICQSLNRMFLIHTDHIDYHKLFNLQLICAEAYQTIGDIDQAYCQYNQAEILAQKLDNRTTIMSYSDIIERDRKRKKLKDIEMKLEFQSEFICNLIKSRKHRIFNLTCENFLTQLNMNNPSSEHCRYIWRQIVLQCVLNPSIAIPCAEWLISYAHSLTRSSLQHANSLYVALNLFLFGYGSKIFQETLNIDVFKMLDDIGRLFEENGNQSKQFSPVHKMAHVWGTAAVAFYLTSDQYKYFVCASIMRVSFELLGIRFLSSGIESLYVLALKHAPEFFTMMTHNPCIKLILPECINYFRRQLENNLTCIRYSTETLNQYVLEVFNIDLTNY